ncbi:thiol reductant ABC exporter subunit CydD [Chryseomicrobium palamuruense]|uniref:Thiol reductant ABC exporter subunit CydD n=1 Tax=Chryseomicrobium palamuruense TaxID=682973 RepID=A0ABV8UXL3_9BACL
MKTLQAWAMQYRLFLGILFLINVLLGITVIGQSYAIVQIVDSVFMESTTFQQIVPYLMGLAAFLLIRTFLNYTNARIGLSLSHHVRHSLRNALTTKWTKIPVEQTGESLTGSRITTLIEQIDQIDPYFREYIPQVIKTTILPLLILIAVFYVNPNSGWIMLITAPFIPISYILIGVKTQQKSERQLAELSRFSGKFLDILQGLPTLKLLGRGKEQSDILQQNNQGFQNTTLSILKIAFASSFFIELIITLGIGLLALEIGFQMLVYETLAFASAFFILAIAPEYYNSLKELGSAFHTGRGSLAAAEQISKELDKEERPVSWGSQFIEGPIRLDANSLSFQYDDGFELYVNHFTLAKQKRAVIIGPSGQGKTTLLNVLAGIYEKQQGELRLNGELRENIDENSWWKTTSYISQQPYLFSGTLRENVSMGEHYTDDEVTKALQTSGLQEWITSLPQGLDTNIGEGGRGLSGGEKQRVALARAFLKKPTMVFFDEPTVGLDVRTEQILANSIDALAETATVLTVAHRLPTIRKAEWLYVIEGGKVTAMGTPEDLLITSPYYQSLMKRGASDANTH